MRVIKATTSATQTIQLSFSFWLETKKESHEWQILLTIDDVRHESWHFKLLFTSIYRVCHGAWDTARIHKCLLNEDSKLQSVLRMQCRGYRRLELEHRAHRRRTPGPEPKKASHWGDL